VTRTPGDVLSTATVAQYPRGTIVALSANPVDGSIFAGWRVDGTVAGLIPALTLTMDAGKTVQAAFSAMPAPTFTDVPPDHPAAAAIAQLIAQGVIRGYDPITFGPYDHTLRAQMAALIARAMGWDAEDHGNTFPDRCDPTGPDAPTANCVDSELWRNVGTMQVYAVATGYRDGSYGPRDDVLSAQAISFITRAMLQKGYWQSQPDNSALYPNVTDPTHRRDLATYVYYAGALPGTAGSAEDWPIWQEPCTRAWFARALTQAINRYFAR
jgi:hypothetical protein